MRHSRLVKGLLHEFMFVILVELYVQCINMLMVFGTMGRCKL